MKYSIVTTSYNQGQFLAQNIESVQEQGVSDWEHIIADGGSTDSSLEVIGRYSHLVWFSEKDRGQSDALNKAIVRAQGDWIVWINSDDYLLPGALRRFEDFIATHPDAQFVYSDCVFVDAAGTVTGHVKGDFDRSSFIHWWRSGAGFPQPGSIFRRSLWERYGPLDIDLHYTMDYDFWLRMLDHVPFVKLNAEQAAYRLHEASKTCQGNYKFLREKFHVTRRYWSKQGGWRGKWMLWLARLVEGRLLVQEGDLQEDMGQPEKARQYRAEGRALWPLAPFSYAHACHVLKSLIGTKRYECLRRGWRGFRH